MMSRDPKDWENSSGHGSQSGATDAIASELQKYYKSVEEEPIPDQLLELLDKLDQAERSGGSDGAN